MFVKLDLILLGVCIRNPTPTRALLQVDTGPHDEQVDWTSRHRRQLSVLMIVRKNCHHHAGDQAGDDDPPVDVRDHDGIGQCAKSENVK